MCSNGFFARTNRAAVRLAAPASGWRSPRPLSKRTAAPSKSQANWTSGQLSPFVCQCHPGEVRGGFVVPMRGQKTVEAPANHFAKIGNFALTPRGGPANDIAKSRDEVVTSVWSGCRPATGWAGGQGSCRAGTVVRGRKKALGLSPDHAPGGAKGAGNETRAVADRCFSARETGGKESHLRAARRQTESVAPGLLRSRRAAADIRGSSRFRARRLGESVRAGGGSVAGFA